MVGAISVANKELKEEFVTKQELLWIVAEQGFGPTEDQLEKNIRNYLDQKRGDVGSQVKLGMPVTRKDIEKQETGDRKKRIQKEARKMIEWEGEEDFGLDRGNMCYITD